MGNRVVSYKLPNRGVVSEKTLQKEIRYNYKSVP